MRNTIFLCISEGVNNVDWKSCYDLKAATVYKAITGTDLNAETMPIARELLLRIGGNCWKVTEESSDPTKDIPKLFEILEDNKQQHWKLKQQVDAVYLAVGFLPGLNKAVEIGYGDREKTTDYFLTLHSKEIINDIIKIENQLSLSTISKLLEHVDAAIVESRNSLATELSIKKDSPFYKNYKCPLTTENFYQAIYSFCWYYSPFHSTKNTTPSRITRETFINAKHLLECLHMNLANPQISNEGVISPVRDIPSLKQLKKFGVKFEAQTDGSVEVTFSGSCLRLPALVCDFKLKTVVRNLLAWESLAVAEQTPVTRYFQFLNELVINVADVKVMSKFGLLKGKWEDFHHVYQLLKRIDGCASNLSVYPAWEKEIKKVKDFYDEKTKRFMVRHKPAVIWVSSVAAASVLLTAFFAKRRRSS